MDELKHLFIQERDIPYCIPLSVAEVDYCCSGKHERLRNRFREAGYETQYRVCWFRWSDLALPEDVASVPHEDACSHVYLEVNIDGAWKVVDATWDPGLASALPVNEWEGEMRVAVPATKTLSREESEAYMASLTSQDAQTDLEKHGKFYRALNEWFEKVRMEAVEPNHFKI